MVVLMDYTYINLQSEEHIPYISMLIECTMWNFMERYCTVKNGKTVAFNLSDYHEIEVLNFIWDSFNHTFQRKTFDIIRYLDKSDIDDIFNHIVYCIDSTILYQPKLPNNDNLPPEGF
jgi:hypothetical protein